MNQIREEFGFLGSPIRSTSGAAGAKGRARGGRKRPSSWGRLSRLGSKSAAILGAVTPKLYKAGEVCEATGVQPYVLRSWEKEFPGIGVQKSPETPRLYRQSDVDQVLRIKQLVFGEGLTLAGARRRLEESSPPTASEAREARDAEIAEVLDTLGADARKRIALVRSGLKSILDVLSTRPGTMPARADATACAATGGNGSASKSTAGSSGRLPARRPSKRRAPAAKASKTKRRRAGA